MGGGPPTSLGLGRAPTGSWYGICLGSGFGRATSGMCLAGTILAGTTTGADFTAVGRCSSQYCAFCLLYVLLEAASGIEALRGDAVVLHCSVKKIKVENESNQGCMKYEGSKNIEV